MSAASTAPLHSHQLSLRVLATVLGEEKRYQPLYNYAKLVQRNQNVPAWRSQVVHWLREVAAEFKFSRETVAVAMNYFDRVLSRSMVQVVHLQLTALVCMLISSKQHEKYPLGGKDFDTFTQICTFDQIRTSELNALSVLKWDINTFTALAFIRLLIEVAPPCPETDMIRRLATDLHELALPDYAVVGYRNSAIATACIAAACHLLNLSIQPLLDMLASAGIVLATPDATAVCNYLLQQYNARMPPVVPHPHTSLAINSSPSCASLSCMAVASTPCASAAAASSGCGSTKSSQPASSPVAASVSTIDVQTPRCIGPTPVSFSCSPASGSVSGLSASDSTNSMSMDVNMIPAAVGAGYGWLSQPSAPVAQHAHVPGPVHARPALPPSASSTAPASTGYVLSPKCARAAESDNHIVSNNGNSFAPGGTSSSAVWPVPAVAKHSAQPQARFPVPTSTGASMVRRDSVTGCVRNDMTDADTLLLPNGMVVRGCRTDSTLTSASGGRCNSDAGCDIILDDDSCSSGSSSFASSSTISNMSNHTFVASLSSASAAGGVSTASFQVGVSTFAAR